MIKLLLLFYVAFIFVFLAVCVKKIRELSIIIADREAEMDLNNPDKE